MKKIYDTFVVCIILLKILYIISMIHIAINHELSDKDENTRLERRNEILKIVTEAMMFILLIIIFRPRRKTNNPGNVITIGGHEKIIFFTLGIMGLLSLDWKQLYQSFKSSPSAI